MATIHFTQNLQRHVKCPSHTTDCETLAELLDVYFEINPTAKGYIVDDQGRLRPHMVIFLDNVPIQDRERFTDVLKPDSEVYVMQALSGG